MTLAEEASRSVQAAWGLLRRQPGAPTAFNATLDGFWRSFFAAVVLAPLQLAYFAFSEPAAGAENAAASTRWIVNIFIYVIGWTVWPLAAFYLTRAMDCGERFIGYVVAYNWSQLLTGPFLVGVDILARAAFDTETALMLNLASLSAVLVYEYLIARQMLAVPPGKAVVVVTSSLVLALVLREVAGLALQLSVPAAG
jgi:hypothetical protein